MYSRIPTLNINNLNLKKYTCIKGVKRVYKYH